MYQSGFWFSDVPRIWEGVMKLSDSRVNTTGERMPVPPSPGMPLRWQMNLAGAFIIVTLAGVILVIAKLVLP
jgi:hypothetical protein